MNLKNLIERNLLKKFDGASVHQIERRFAQAMAYLNLAKGLFSNSSSDTNIIIYTNVYNAVRIIGEAFLLLYGYKAGIKDHHKTVIFASKILMDDESMKNVFIRLDKMRKTRNTIDYDIDTLDVSDATIKQSISDAEKFARLAQKHIEEKDKQQKLI